MFKRASIFIFISMPILSGCQNFGVVEAGRVYRSAQLDGEEIKELSARYKIKMIINLRGAKPGTAWYDEEVKAARSAGLELHSARWSANRLPMSVELLPVIELLESGPFPILIHCRAGADRSGLASALYLILRGLLLEQARQELTVFHGHIPIASTRAMDDFLDLYSRQSNGKSLKRWIREDYPELRRAWLNR
jgi:protein tyrosine/serine phosphatase